METEKASKILEIKNILKESMENSFEKTNYSIKDALFKERVEFAGIPKRYLVANPDDGKKIEGGKGYWFVGPVGVGKTWLAVSTLIKYIKEGHEGLFVTVPDMLEDIRRGFNDPEQSKTLKKACTVRLLVLDDLGVEKQSEWVAEKLYQIVNTRYNNMLPTIVTTNLSVENTEKVLGERLVSRLLGCCEAIVIEGPDRRLKRGDSID
jgi:DNA replication protein DnaC